MRFAGDGKGRAIDNIEHSDFVENSVKINKKNNSFYSRKINYLKPSKKWGKSLNS